MEQKEKLCDEVEFTFLCDRVSVVGECEAAVAGRTRCGWVKFREFGELLYDSRFPLELKGVGYRVM